MFLPLLLLLLFTIPPPIDAEQSTRYEQNELTRFFFGLWALLGSARPLAIPLQLANYFI